MYDQSRHWRVKKIINVQKIDQFAVIKMLRKINLKHGAIFCRRLISHIELISDIEFSTLFTPKTGIFQFPYTVFCPKSSIFCQNFNQKLGYALVRPFLYFNHFHIFDLSCTSNALYFDLSTSTSLLRHFVKSGLLIGREVQVEVQFWSK